MPDVISQAFQVMSVVQGPRQSGKTYKAMRLIHEHYLRGLYAETLVVFPDAGYVRWWMNMWQRKFPRIPTPPYVIIGNLLPVRNRVVSLAVVEDVNGFDNGIWDPRIETLLASMSLRPDSEIVFTSNFNGLNLRSHSRKYTTGDVGRGRLKMVRKNLAKKSGRTE